MSFVDVFVGNYTIIDFDLYELWLRGLSGKLMLISHFSSPSGRVVKVADFIMAHNHLIISPLWLV